MIFVWDGGPVRAVQPQMFRIKTVSGRQLLLLYSVQCRSEVCLVELRLADRMSETRRMWQNVCQLHFTSPVWIALQQSTVHTCTVRYMRYCTSHVEMEDSQAGRATTEKMSGTEVPSLGGTLSVLVPLGKDLTATYSKHWWIMDQDWGRFVKEVSRVQSILTWDPPPYIAQIDQTQKRGNMFRKLHQIWFQLWANLFQLSGLLEWKGVDESVDKRERKPIYTNNKLSNVIVSSQSVLYFRPAKVKD